MRALLLLLVALHTGCAQRLTEESPATSSAIEKTLPPVCVDEINEIEVEFDVLNNEALPLEVVSLTSSCGCARAHLDEYAIAPGRTTKLRISVHLNGVSGTSLVTSRLVLADGRERTYSVKIPTFRQIEFQANEISLGEIGTGASSRSVIVETHAPSFEVPPRIEAVHATSPELSCRVGESRIVRHDHVATRSTVVYVDFLSAPIESRCPAESRLIAQCNWKGRQYTAAVPLSWSAKNAWRVTPSRIFFSCHHLLAGSATAELLVENTNDERFVIRQIDSSHPEIKVSFSDHDPSNRHSLLVTALSSKDTVLLGHVTITVETDEEHSLRVPATVFCSEETFERGP
jgi:hypothetical protein